MQIHPHDSSEVLDVLILTPNSHPRAQALSAAAKTWFDRKNLPVVTDISHMSAPEYFATVPPHWTIGVELENGMIGVILKATLQ